MEVAIEMPDLAAITITMTTWEIKTKPNLH